jgi:hypothetical protein
MSFRSELRTAEGKQYMEGVKMPAFLKHAWRYLVGATGAAILFVAMPTGASANTLELCINSAGRVKGINVASCPFTSLVFQTVGPQGPQGPPGVDGDPGDEGPPGVTGGAGGQGPMGAMGAFGPTGPAGDAGGTGAKGPPGPMGEDGIKGLTGPQGIAGPAGVDGTNGFNEPNVSLLTGGTLGRLGEMENVSLTGANTVTVNLLRMGPGNGSDTSDATQVPMSEGGKAANLWVNTDHHPGVDPTGPPAAGLPISYFFFLCNGDFPGSCAVSCVITDPDTTCNDPVEVVTPHTQSFAQGNVLSVFAYSDNLNANEADVKWSVEYFHNVVLVPLI